MTDPAAPHGEHLYEGGLYAPPPRSFDRAVEPLRRAALWTHVRTLGLAPGARVLEIGAGDGRLLEALARRGHDVAGIEPSSAAGRARARGLDVGRTTLAAAELEPRSVDAVVLWHVLEHIAEPREALAHAAVALRAGGSVVAVVPNLASLQARLGGDRWFHQDVPRHAVHYTPDGLERLFARAGLAPVRRRAFVPDQDLLGMTQTLLNRATRGRDVGFRLLKRAGGTTRRDAVVSALLVTPAAVAALAVEPVAAAVGRNGSIVVGGVRSADRTPE